MGFSSGIAGYAKATKLSISDAVVAVNAQIVISTIKNTPVDKGTARSSWFASFDTPSDEVTDSTNESKALSDVLRYVDGSAGEVFYLTNNLPYIRPLEYGWSTQAPSGMLRIAIKSANTQLRKFTTSK